MGIPPQTPPPYPTSRAQWKAQREQAKAQARMQRDAWRARYRSNARGSLAGPLLLIAIGVVALLITTRNIDALVFWHWYGHWWPLVLIGAGVILALESLAFSSYSRIRLGGGVVLLAILLAILGIGAAHNNVNWGAVGNQIDFGNVDLLQMFGTKHQAQEQIVHALPEGATLVIQNPHGSVTIASGDPGDGQMHLTLDKTVYTDSDDKATRDLQTFEPLITSNGSTVTVHMPWSNNRIADMTIAMPAKTAVDIQARGDVSVHGRQAAVSVHDNHGDVQLDNIAGSVGVSMQHGDFSASHIQGQLDLHGHMNDVTLSDVTGNATMEGDFFGDVHLKNLGGSVHLHSSRTDLQLAKLPGSATLDGGNLSVSNAGGPIDVRTDAKDIAMDSVSGALNLRNTNGSIAVTTTQPIGAMDIHNSNGSVNVTLPADAGFSVDATANDGEIHSDFPLSVQNQSNRGIASGNVGGGGPLIKIAADRGDITLHKD